MLEQKVRRTIEQHRMVHPGEKVLAGVSGGRDSIVLLDILARVLPDSGTALAVCCVNHGLRPEAREELEFVRRRARYYGIPFLGKAVDVPGGRAPGESVEEAARRLRYRALSEAAGEWGADRIAVGHHRDDHVETVLMRIILGTGIDGLAGIPPVRGPIIRPLIGCTLDEIAAYARTRRLEWRLDESNLDTSFFRNKVRLALIPDLERGYNPRIKDALARLSEIAREENRWLDGLAHRAEGEVIEEHPLFAGAPSITFSRSSLTQLPAALQRRLIYRGWSRAAGTHTSPGGEAPEGAPGFPYPALTAPVPWRGPDFESIEEIRALAAHPEAGGKSRALDLPGGIRARATPAHLHIFARFLEESPDYSYPLPVPGSVDLAQIGLTVQTRWIEGEDGWSSFHSPRPPAPPRSFGHNMPYEKGGDSGGPVGELATNRRWEVLLKAKVLPCGGGELVVRNARPGDRWERPGSLPARRLRTVLADERVPLPVRSSAPVIVSRDRIVAAAPPGAVPDAAARADGSGPAKNIAVTVRPTEA